MTERKPAPFEAGDNSFAYELMREYGSVALKTLSAVFLDEEQAEALQDSTDFVIRDFDERGTIVPDARQDPARHTLSVVIEPRTIEEYAEDVSDDIDDVSKTDIIRVLIGAGVAKTILGWKVSHLELSNPGVMQAHKERICNRNELWSSTADFEDQDETHTANIRRAVERLGDGELMRVNWLRFSLGASLRHISDVPNLQHSIVTLAQRELLLKEKTRANELDYNFQWQEKESAFAVYDSKTPLIELAFSFPMTPAEEQEFVRQE